MSMKISIIDGSYPDADCGTSMFSIDCENNSLFENSEVTFVHENFDTSDNTLYYKLEPASSIVEEFNTLCTLRVFYDDYPPDE